MTRTAATDAKTWVAGAAVITFGVVVGMRVLLASGDTALDLAALHSAVKAPVHEQEVRAILGRIEQALADTQRFVLNPREPAPLGSEIIVLTLDITNDQRLGFLRDNFASVRFAQQDAILCDVEFLDLLCGWVGSGEDDGVGFEVWEYADRVPESLVALAILHEFGHMSAQQGQDDAETQADKFAWDYFDRMLPQEIARGPFLAMCLNEMAHILRVRRADPGQASIDFLTRSESHPPFTERVFRLFGEVVRSVSTDEVSEEERAAIVALCDAFSQSASQTAPRRIDVAQSESEIHLSGADSIIFKRGLRFKGYLANHDAFVASTVDSDDVFAVSFIDGSVSPLRDGEAYGTGVESSFQATVAEDRRVVEIVRRGLHAPIRIEVVGPPGIVAQVGSELETFHIGASSRFMLCSLPNKLVQVDLKRRVVVDELVIPGLNGQSTVVPSNRSMRVFVVSPRWLGESMEVAGAIYELGSGSKAVPTIVMVGFIVGLPVFLVILRRIGLGRGPSPATVRN